MDERSSKAKVNALRSRRIRFAIAVGLFFLLAACSYHLWTIIPKFPEPVYRPDSYQDFILGLQGWDATYLVPSAEQLDTTKNEWSFHILLKSRSGYEPEGYVLAESVDAGSGDSIFCITARLGEKGGLPPPYEPVYYAGTKIQTLTFEDETQAWFLFGGVNYMITSAPSAPQDALSLAKSLLAVAVENG